MVRDANHFHHLDYYCLFLHGTIGDAKGGKNKSCFNDFNCVKVLVHYNHGCKILHL